MKDYFNEKAESNFEGAKNVLAEMNKLNSDMK